MSLTVGLASTASTLCSKDRMSEWLSRVAESDDYVERNTTTPASITSTVIKGEASLLHPIPMKFNRSATCTVLAGLLVVAVGVSGSGVALAAQDTATDNGTQSVVNDLEQLLQQLDAFLETVADLLRTIRSISGEGGGGE